jgi:[ribosomal protein S18]-alanine N-acetyltransferase
MPQRPYTIDAMNEGDIDAVLAIDSALSAAQLKEELARPWARLWVARVLDKCAVAFLLVWTVADEVHILDVAVDVAYRRRGIARALMDEALALAREKKARHLLLEVRKSNAPAIALYQSLGFSEMGVRSRYYSDNEDAIEMILRQEPD